MPSRLIYPGLIVLAVAVGFTVTKKIMDLGDQLGVAVCDAFNSQAA